METTKSRGDVAEYKVVAELLERGFTVLMPCGDRLPYDIGIDLDGKLLRVQVRRAWYNSSSKCWMIDVRRSQTNRKEWKHTTHDATKYDFMVSWIPGSTAFYVIPAEVACTYGSGVPFTATSKAAVYRDAWYLLDAGRVSAPSAAS